PCRLRRNTTVRAPDGGLFSTASRPPQVATGRYSDRDLDSEGAAQQILCPPFDVNSGRPASCVAFGQVLHQSAFSSVKQLKRCSVLGFSQRRAKPLCNAERIGRCAQKVDDVQHVLANPLTVELEHGKQVLPLDV